MRDFWHWCMEKEIQVQVELVPTAQDQADFWSRRPQDHGDYTLDKNLFHFLHKHLQHHILPEIDMFASPGNHQLKDLFHDTPIGKQTGRML